MRIKCIGNRRTYEINESGINRQYLTKYESLKIGEEYNVYGMMIDDKKVYYYICETEQDLFPIHRLDSLFELTDPRLSRYWIFGIIEGLKNYPTWIFPEWILEPYFHDKLTDHEKREVKIFKKYKQLMDLEFPDPSIKLSATQLDDEWLMCPTCIDAWKTTSKDGMVICPKCKQMMHNPAYNEDYISWKKEDRLSD